MINISNSGYLYMKYYLHIFLPLMPFHIKRITYDFSVIVSNGEQRDVEFMSVTHKYKSLYLILIFWCLRHFQQYFSYIMATSVSGRRSRSTWREPPTMGKQLANFITCGCESSAPFFCNLQNRARTHAVLVIGLYEMLGNPTT